MAFARIIHARIWVCGAIALSGILLSWSLSHVRFFQLVHLKALDTLFLVRGTQPTSNVVLLTIDQESLETFPDAVLFWHPYYAEAIRAAADAGAKVLALDVTFGIPVAKWAPDHDQLLAEAVSEASSRMPAVCGFVPSVMTRQAEWPVPVNMIASALGLAAMANLTVDADDFVRRQELIEQPSGGASPAIRGLAFRTAELYLGQEARIEEGRLLLGGREIPIDADRTIAINYAGPPGTFPRVSLSDFVLAAREGRKAQLEQWVKGKAVLLGPDGIDDRHATPFYTAFRGARWNTAGVEIHANTLHTLLSGKFLRPVPELVRWLALALVAAATVAIMVSRPAGHAMLWLAASFAVTLACSYLLFLRGWLLSVSEMVLTGVLVLLGALAYRFLSAERRGNLFRKAISLFVGTRVASSLERSNTIALSGTRETLTIMFTDIRGFTAFCDERDAGEVVDVLNDYLAAMVSIIVSHRGQVNKFIGDGILAIFSDEDGTRPGDHATRAVRCAIEMVSRPGRLKTGAGIHTGEAVVGNVGSSDKMEYTVLGDTVNLASRLESLNKEHKTQVLLSEATRRLLDEDLETVHLGATPVRGKAEPLNLYTPAVLAGAAASAALSVKES